MCHSLASDARVASPVLLSRCVAASSWMAMLPRCAPGDPPRPTERTLQRAGIFDALQWIARDEAGSVLDSRATHSTTASRGRRQTATSLRGPREDAERNRADVVLFRGRQGRALCFHIMRGRAVRSPGLLQGRMCPDVRTFPVFNPPAAQLHHPKHCWQKRIRAQLALLFLAV